MRDRFLHPLRPSTGEKRLLAAIFCVGLCGALLSFVIVTQMGASKQYLRAMTHADAWFYFSGIAGALGGLYLGRDWFGHSGIAGTIRFIGGIIVVSFTGGLIGGSLAIPLYGTMFGPLMVGLTLWGNPALGIFWLAALTASHVLVRTWRRERRSLFVPITMPVRKKAQPAPRTGNWLAPQVRS